MKALRTFALLLAIGAAFAGGYVYRAIKSGSASAGTKSVRKVLYWVDPMHPAYKSDKPGIAPDCGMKLEPVYADGGAGVPASRLVCSLAPPDLMPSLAGWEACAT
jgi:Cu(I)/Ag(I) efflux system membrane fusion protein